MNHSTQHDAETTSQDVSEHPFSTALVLGGGGSAGNAWLIGVIAGLFEGGLDVTDADLIIGTSAGSTAAAQMAGATPAELLAAVLAAAPRPRAGSAGSDRGPAPKPTTSYMETTSAIIAAAEDAADMRRRMGEWALEMGCGVGQLCAAVAHHRRRSAAQSALAGTIDAHHGGRCPYR